MLPPKAAATIRWRIHTLRSGLLGIGFLAMLAAGAMLLVLNLSVPLSGAHGGVALNGWALIVAALALGRASVAAQSPVLTRSPQSPDEARRYRVVVRSKRVLSALTAIPFAAVLWLSLMHEPQAVRMNVAAALGAYFILMAAFGLWYAFRCRSHLNRLRAARLQPAGAVGGES
jgi:hypothetical protein